MDYRRSKGDADPLEMSEREERTKRLLWRRGDVPANREGYKWRFRDKSVPARPSKASGWTERKVCVGGEL